MKQTIRLTESELKHIIKEAVKGVTSSHDYSDFTGKTPDYYPHTQQDDKDTDCTSVSRGGLEEVVRDVINEMINEGLLGKIFGKNQSNNTAQSGNANQTRDILPNGVFKDWKLVCQNYSLRPTVRIYTIKTDRGTLYASYETAENYGDAYGRGLINKLKQMGFNVYGEAEFSNVVNPYCRK